MSMSAMFFAEAGVLCCRVDEDVVADAFEALVGAVYLDRGLQAASDFVVKLAEVRAFQQTHAHGHAGQKVYACNSLRMSCISEPLPGQICQR